MVGWRAHVVYHTGLGDIDFLLLPALTFFMSRRLAIVGIAEREPLICWKLGEELLQVKHVELVADELGLYLSQCNSQGRSFRRLKTCWATTIKNEEGE
jgi:hypothetical protein